MAGGARQHFWAGGRSSGCSEMEAELQLLFLTEFADPITFCTKDLPAQGRVHQAITSNGGEVTDELGPHTVCLVQEPAPQSNMGTLPPYNTFSVNFIRDSVWAKKLQPLKDYWVHKVADFDDKFDPLDVMIGNLTWEDCRKEAPSSTSESVAVDPDDEIFNQADTFKQPVRSSISSKGRTSYTGAERLRMLEYIHKKKMYDKVNGNYIWQRMEEREVCPGRTWQSMREHFRRYIFHQLDQFPDHLTAGFRRSSQPRGFYRRPAPAPTPPQAPPQIQVSHSSDEDTDIEDTQEDGGESRVEHTAARGGCGGSSAHKSTRNERRKESPEATFISSHTSTQRDKRRESVKDRRAFVPPSQTDERGANDNQNEEDELPDLQRVSGAVGRGKGSGGEETNQAHEVTTQKKKRSENVKDSGEKRKSEECTSRVSVAAPRKVRREEERQEYARGESEGPSVTILHSDTEEVATERHMSEIKKEVEFSTYHKNTDEEERNEGECNVGSPSILTSRDNSLMDRYLLVQESQEFSISHHPPSREAEKKDSRGDKGSQVDHLQEEQQEPDSSMEILEQPEEGFVSDKGAQSQPHRSHKSSSRGKEDRLPSSSTQRGQETPLVTPPHQPSGVTEEIVLFSDVFSSPEIPIPSASISERGMSASTRHATVTEDNRSVTSVDDDKEGEEENKSPGKELSQSAVVTKGNKNMSNRNIGRTDPRRPVVSRNSEVEQETEPLGKESYQLSVPHSKGSQEELCQQVVEPLSAPSCDTNLPPEGFGCDTIVSRQTVVKDHIRRTNKESEDDQEEREGAGCSEPLARSVVDMNIHGELCKSLERQEEEVITANKESTNDEEEREGEAKSSRALLGSTIHGSVRSAVNEKAGHEELDDGQEEEQSQDQELESEEDGGEEQDDEIEEERGAEVDGAEETEEIELLDHVEEEEEEEETGGTRKGSRDRTKRHNATQQLEEEETGEKVGVEEASAAEKETEVEEEIEDAETDFNPDDDEEEEEVKEETEVSTRKRVRRRSNSDSEVDEEDEDEEKETATRKKSPAKGKGQNIAQRSAYPSAVLAMRSKSREQSPPHTAHGGPGTSQSGRRQHTQERRAYPQHKSLPRNKITGTYTTEEDLAIITYIQRNDAYDRVAGRTFWEEMARNFVTGRTWQSLKERFRKRIMTNLHAYIAHGLKKKIILMFEERITMKTGSSTNKRQQQWWPERKSRPKRSNAQSAGRKGRGVSSSESEEESEEKSDSDPQPRVSSTKSRNCRLKDAESEESSNSQVRRQRRNPQHSPSEDSDTEESCTESRRQPRHPEGRQQQQRQCQALRERPRAARGRKVAPGKSGHTKLKPGLTCGDITSESDTYKSWKLTILQDALGKQSDEGASCSSLPHSKKATHHPLHKKRRLLDPQEMCLLSPESSPPQPSEDVPRGLMQQQGRYKEDGLPANPGPKGQSIKQTTSRGSDSVDDSDSHEEGCAEQEARNTTPGISPPLESDLDESDQDSLPNLSVHSTPSTQKGRHHNSDEEEVSGKEDEEEEETSRASDCLFEIESETE